MANSLDIASAPAPIKKPADPFAGDLFAASEPNVIVPENLPAEERFAHPRRRDATESWADQLPKISEQALAESALIESLPDGFDQQILDVVTRSLQATVFPQQDRVECELVSASECELISEVAGFDPARQVAIHLTLGAERSAAILLLANDTVTDAIDQIFGSSGHRLTGPLSPVEGAIVEFLAAKIVANLNRELIPLSFSVAGLKASPQEFFHDHERGSGVDVEIRADDFRHVARLLLSRQFVWTLAAALGGDRSAARTRLSRLIPSVDLRARLGSTRLDAANIASLEAGDIVIIEDPSFDWNNGSPVGSMTVFAGAGTNVSIAGTIVTDSPNGISILVSEVISREPARLPARTMSMDKKEITSIEADSEIDSMANVRTENNLPAPETQEMSPAIDNIQVRLRVELAGNKMTLREVSELRAGQIIDLGRQANDSVTLITDGGEEAIGIGELVDIDGRLGVRLTKVFVS